MPSEGSPRILISRLGPIGDAILSLPVACALRRSFPDAFIGWVVEKPAAQVVRGHQALDVVIELQPRWNKTLTGICGAREKLVAEKFDLTIDCQGDTASSLACQLTGASRRIGFAAPYACPMSRLASTERVEPVFPHLTDRSLELLTPLGVDAPRVEWHMPLSREARMWAARWRRTIPADKVAVLNPGATWPSKLWETERFAETARYLNQQYGYTSTVVWGNVQELNMAQSIIARSGDSAVLAPQTDLQHLATLIDESDLFISGDTGPMHMAVALETPTIGLYGATLPGMSGPYGQIALQRAYEKGSPRHRRRADNRAMREITVQDVCAAIDEIEARGKMMKVAA